MSKDRSSSYENLVSLSTKAALLNGVGMLLGWDQETYMPKNGADVRAMQNELIAGELHKIKTSKEFENYLSKLIDLKTGKILDPSLSEEQVASLKLYRRDFLQEVKLPQKFVEEFASITSTAHHRWLDARKKNDFKIFQPYLEKIVDLNKKKADFLGYSDHPYDALIDLFEPQMNAKTLITLFEKLKIPLTTLLKKIQIKPDPKTPYFQKTYSHDLQFDFGKKIVHAMGLDTTFTRLDESVHPMCIPIHPTDNRLTTRIYPSHFTVNILSCLHEGGHALYHTNLPLNHYGTPLCDASSLGIDESQSRTWETIVGRSLPFWKYYFPKLQKIYPENLANVSLEDFYKGLNIVEPSMIRVDSDEVSYNLHILLRFEIELALLEGTLKVSDAPEAWNSKMRNYLSITPKADSEGILQDIHWSMGAIGYFPTYTLGNLYAAQFFETFLKHNPKWENQLESGNLTPLAQWQKEHIHSHGRRYMPEELCKKVTGKPLSEKPFTDYLDRKYAVIYDL